ncbi:TetR/AcrR family transcriptional regulator [Roseibium sp.]|uniref:TetR/AcrR family transcriptional regulator n=1 Tax=Roseibium sp. TaxID=1936156 RepID=UPI003A97CADD
MTQTKQTRKRDGTLRSDLVAAGIDILKEKGMEGLSLRECAARAGVSHAAPGYHFRNLAGLNTAIAAQGFKLFADAMDNRRKTADATPSAQLQAICEGYLDFARSHRELFLFMFSGQEFSGDNDDFGEASGRAYAILRETCSPLVPSGSDPEEIELLVWSLIHGYSHLATVNKKRPTRLGEALPPFPALLAHLDFKNVK